uniref:Uncharacterized protein n=1 Tax=Oryza nivara TaxID=4536 RepID=A0A0E0I2T9_ORYNI
MNAYKGRHKLPRTRTRTPEGPVASRAQPLNPDGLSSPTAVTRRGRRAPAAKATPPGAAAREDLKGAAREEHSRRALVAGCIAAAARRRTAGQAGRQRLSGGQRRFGGSGGTARAGGLRPAACGSAAEDHLIVARVLSRAILHPPLAVEKLGSNHKKEHQEAVAGTATEK